jgi:prefoldin subunit 5
MNESKSPEDQIKQLTNLNEFLKKKLAQAAVKIQELKRELRKMDPRTKVNELRKSGL